MSGDHNMNQNDFNPDWLCTCGDLTTLGVVHRKDAPCYYPEKREWVGLTRNESMAIINQFVGEDWSYAVAAIEEKLKEKNCDPN